MERVLVARVGSERFAFPLADVLEVVDTPVLAPVALAPAGVAGQCEHRGVLVPVLEAGRLLGTREPDAAEGAPAPGVLLVLESGGARMALRADDVVDMVAVTDADRRAVPNAAGAAAGLLDAVLQLADGIAGLVAMEALRGAMRARLTTEGT